MPISTTTNLPLLFAGIGTMIAALAHLGVIVGGPDWYRAFGAGEGMARLAERGSAYPALVTAGIASVLGVWAALALSGAGVLPRVPWLKALLLLIAAVFLARGVLGVPVVLLVDSPHTNELAQRMGFMVGSSLVCVLLGAGYLIGAWRLD